jgi:hypothetical protein
VPAAGLQRWGQEASHDARSYLNREGVFGPVFSKGGEINVSVMRIETGVVKIGSMGVQASLLDIVEG